MSSPRPGATSQPDGISRHDATSQPDDSSRPDATSRPGGTLRPDATTRPAPPAHPPEHWKTRPYPMLNRKPHNVPYHNLLLLIWVLCGVNDTRIEKYLVVHIS